MEKMEIPENVKINILAVLLSQGRGNGVALDDFCQLFQNVIHQPLHFRAFGYSSLMEFFQAMRNDVRLKYVRHEETWKVFGIPRPNTFSLTERGEQLTMTVASGQRRVTHTPDPMFQRQQSYGSYGFDVASILSTEPDLDMVPVDVSKLVIVPDARGLFTVCFRPERKPRDWKSLRDMFSMAGPVEHIDERPDIISVIYSRADMVVLALKMFPFLGLTLAPANDGSRLPCLFGRGNYTFKGKRRKRRLVEVVVSNLDKSSMITKWHIEELFAGYDLQGINILYNPDLTADKEDDLHLRVRVHSEATTGAAVRCAVHQHVQHQSKACVKLTTEAEARTLIADFTGQTFRGKKLILSKTGDPRPKASKEGQNQEQSFSKKTPIASPTLEQQFIPERESPLPYEGSEMPYQERLQGMGPRLQGMGPQLQSMETRLQGMGPQPQGMGPRLQGMGPQPQGMGPRLQDMEPQLQGMGTRLQGMESQLQGMGPQLQCMGTRLQGMEPQLQGMGPQLQGMGTRLQGMGPQLQDMGPQLQGMEPQLQGMGTPGTEECPETHRHHLTSVVEDYIRETGVELPIIFVTNFRNTFTERDLSRLFRKYNPVSVTMADTAKGSKKAYIQVQDVEMMRKAISEMCYRPILGQKLKVDVPYFLPKLREQILGTDGRISDLGWIKDRPPQVMGNEGILQELVEARNLAVTGLMAQEPRLSVGEKIEVVVTNVISDHFFLGQIVEEGSTEKLRQISEEIHRLCKNPPPSKQEGCCLAMYRKDRQYHRSWILSSAKARMVEVYYLDYGNMDTVPCENTCSCDESWIWELPPVAVPFTLIEPIVKLKDRLMSHISVEVKSIQEGSLVVAKPVSLVPDWKAVIDTDAFIF